MICLERQLSETEIAALGEPIGRRTKAARAWCEALKHFKRQRKPGDTLWDFDTSPESWANLRGSRGLVILRGTTIVTEFIVMEN